LATLVGLGLPPARADLLVSSSMTTSTGQVLRYDQQTGAFVDVFIDAFSGGPGGTYGGMTIGPDGNLYVGKTITMIGLPGEVQRYNLSTGVFRDNFVPQGSGGLTQAGTVAFGPDSNLYVRNGTPVGTFNDSIFRYDGRTGTFLGAFVPPTGGEISDFVFGPDRNLYTTATSGNVLRYDGMTGQFLGLFAGGIGGDFRGLVFGPDGNLYVTNDAFINSTVKRFDGMTGTFLGNFVGPGSGGLFNPEDLVFGPDGNLYVSNSGDNSVKRYDGTTGAFLGDFVLPGSGGLRSPGALLFTSPTAVPEPGTLALFGIGGGLLGYLWRRRGKGA
jgi:DNA-binding beta-propeller fold protein YncE